jgi:hypothetical protein
MDISEVRSIAKEAYIYGYPIIENYKVMYAYSVDKDGDQYKGPFNQITGEARLYTPADKTVVTPNSDTPYSFVVMDLRAEPMVLTVPEMEPDRYFSIQFIDLYTHNFDYIGTRATGNGGGVYMIAGPDWKGEKPEGVDTVFKSETQLVLALYRTQLLSPDDMENVKKLQAGYLAQPLSEFSGSMSSNLSEPIAWPAPQKDMTESLSFFGYLNFLLQFTPTHPSERELMDRFARIGVGAGLPFDEADMTPEMKSAMLAGITDAWKDFEALQKRTDAGEYTSGDMFGTREFLDNNYLFRMAAAKIGLYGNSREEAFYPIYMLDADGAGLDASQYHYTLTLEKAPYPVAKAFWSVTMYDGKSQLLIDNPLSRYLINSPMLESLQRNPDGKSVTLYLQKDPPDSDRESNWLPAPNGPFYVVMRLYIPGPEVIDGTWVRPEIQRVQ